MTTVKISKSIWALRPKRKAWDYAKQISFLGAEYSADLKDWYVRDESTRKKIIGWVVDHEARFGR